MEIAECGMRIAEWRSGGAAPGGVAVVSGGAEGGRARWFWGALKGRPTINRTNPQLSTPPLLALFTSLR